MERNDTLNEYIYITHPIMQERVMINKTALNRYRKDGWEISEQQFGDSKPAPKKRGRKPAAEASAE